MTQAFLERLRDVTGFAEAGLTARDGRPLVSIKGGSEERLLGGGALRTERFAVCAQGSLSDAEGAVSYLRENPPEGCFSLTVSRPPYVYFDKEIMYCAFEVTVTGRIMDE